MKAISLWEPWASLVMLGAKRNETRSWPTKYRGPLLICAAKGGLTLTALRSLVREEPFRTALQPLEQYRGVCAVKDLNHGKAVCIVDLVDCIPTGEFLTPRNCDDATWAEMQFGDYTKGRYVWVTTNLRRIEKPFRVKGKQGFFNVPCVIDVTNTTVLVRTDYLSQEINKAVKKS